MMVAEDPTSSISYDLTAYTQLDKEYKEQPALYLNRYFSQQFYTHTVILKRKHGEIEPSQPTDLPDSQTPANIVPKEWQYVLMSPNKLCVIGIAKQHPLLDPAMREQVGSITKVIYADNVKNSVIKGKGKKQSLRLMPSTKICTVQTSTGKEYILRAAVKGVLMEWNSRLETDPQLIYSHPEQAFVAIIKPGTDDSSKILSDCVSSTD
ncbi:hypothetical protein GGI25_000363 [Coemansia spiralis]|uniref:Protein Abitram n=2 Tax=Coemansia TaxID=4863 RepID=A0A9W8L127_9FUNG|nr:hypothetical protein EDC05_000190 [Coemansia umbellata]KAJ2625943.1 hypothetical protein GGI26_000027 [Coemansia sp. RSA 1358]KAJ2680728.1 hypothetical protein GGI25_000363 [Coemansia spiralis]